MKMCDCDAGTDLLTTIPCFLTTPNTKSRIALTLFYIFIVLICLYTMYTHLYYLIVLYPIHIFHIYIPTRLILSYNPVRALFTWFISGRLSQLMLLVYLSSTPLLRAKRNRGREHLVVWMGS